MLSRSRDWLRQRRDDGQRALRSDRLRDVFQWAPPDLALVLVVTDERTSIFVNIVTCLTRAPVLEGLDDLGDLISITLKRTLIFCVSTTVLLLIMVHQNAQRASNRSGV